MTQFQNAWNKASQALNRNNSKQYEQGGQKQGEGQSEDATMKAAGKIAELGGRQLSHDFSKQVEFISVYVREAHPGECCPHHATFSGRKGLRCSRKDKPAQ